MQTQPYMHAEGIQNEHLKNGKTDAHAEHVNKELMHMVAQAQHAHQFLTHMFSVCLKVEACA
jgi:hypothetical protein